MSERVLIVEYEGAVAWLRLSRPDVLNALGDEVLSELADALDVIEQDDGIRVVVITGSGRAFSAGDDLNSIIDADGDVDIDHLMTRVQSGTALIQRLRTLSKPTIAAVNGYAVAGGMSIMMACDIVIASEDAQIGDGHAKYGIVSGSGGTVRLARIAGPLVAKYMAFTGETMGASDLLATGLVNEVVPRNHLEARVTDLAGSLAKRSPRVLASMKRLINEGMDMTAGQAASAAQQSLEFHLRSCSDMQEGLAAFREKREADFSPSTTLSEVKSG